MKGLNSFSELDYSNHRTSSDELIVNKDDIFDFTKLALLYLHFLFCKFVTQHQHFVIKQISNFSDHYVRRQIGLFLTFITGLLRRMACIA